MVLLLILTVAVSWSYLVLRDRPPEEYVKLYLLITLLIWVEEVVFFRVLQLYEGRLHLFANPTTDSVLASFVVMSGIEPLLAVLYARYSQQHPVLHAALWSALLGVTEAILVRLGVWVYLSDFWRPAYTSVAFCFFFLLVAWLSKRLDQVPGWVYVYTIVLWSGILIDVLLQGAAQFWVYHVTWLTSWLQGNRLLSLGVEAMLVAPMGAWVCLPLWNSGWKFSHIAFRMLLAVTILLVVEVMAARSGWLTFRTWSLPLSVLRDTITFVIPMGFVYWLRQRPGIPVR